MFTEQVLKSLLSLKPFSSPARARQPAMEGIHISVDAEAKTITALATDRCAAVRMVITVPECAGESWSRNVSLATLNAALATVKANGQPVSSFPETNLPEFPDKLEGLIDKFVAADDSTDHGSYNAKYLGAIAKVNVGGDKSGRWAIRTVDADRSDSVVLVAEAVYDNYEATVVVMPLFGR